MKSKPRTSFFNIKRFDPDLIARYTRNCLFFAVLEVVLYKVILLMGKVNSLTFLDLIAFLNYKFVGLCFILVLDLTFGGILTLLVILYFSISFVYYMMAELKVHAAGISLGSELGKILFHFSRLFSILLKIHM